METQAGQGREGRKALGRGLLRAGGAKPERARAPSLRLLMRARPIAAAAAGHFISLLPRRLLASPC